MSDLNGTPTPTPNTAPAMPLPELAPEAEVAAQGAGEATEAALDDWAAALAEQNGNDDVAPAAAGVFQPLSKVTSTATRNDIDMILDIPVQMTVELGRTKIAIRNLLQLAQGSVVELDGLAGEPMDVLVNGCLIAQGEVVVVNDKFGIRLTDIITPSERIRKLNR
jgi:flagellar motor switch protein FliN